MISYLKSSYFLMRHLLIIASLGALYLLLLTFLFLITSHFSMKLKLSRLLNPRNSLELSKLNDNALEHLLPPPLQLNLSETLALAEVETSNLPALYYAHWKLMMKDKEKDQNDQAKEKGFQEFEKTILNFCSKVRFPAPYRLRMNNIFWQVLTVEVKNEIFSTTLISYLLNAYYDDRLFGVPKVVSLWVSSNQESVKAQDWWCLLWFNHTTFPLISKVSELDPIWPPYWNWGRENGVYGPLLATCKVPPELTGHVPTAVSIQSVGDCNQVEVEPTNVLRIINNRPPPKGNFAENQSMSIGICVKAMRFETYDFSVRLVEWLEMVRLLGAEKVYFYILGAQRSILRVLNYYTEKGFVDWQNSTLPGEQPNTNSLHNLFYSENISLYQPQEMTELNDCLYRNLYRHKFVLFMDVDEVVLPIVKEEREEEDNKENSQFSPLKKMTIPNSWQELITEVESQFPAYLPKKSYYALASSNVYEAFEVTEKELKNFKGSRFQSQKEPIPFYLYMMRHIQRSLPSKRGFGFKAFHRTAHVTMVHNHYPLRCINTTGYHSCYGEDLSPERYLLYHYRRWREPPKTCQIKKSSNMTEEEVYDCTIVNDQWSAWRYFEQLRDRVRESLLDIFGDGESRGKFR